MITIKEKLKPISLKGLGRSWQKLDEKTKKECGSWFNYIKQKRQTIFIDVEIKKPRKRKKHKKEKKTINYRKIVEKIIDRPLKEEEIVHHIDGNRSNNTIENLYICKNRQYHQRIHSDIHWFAYELIRKGLIKFNIKTGKYFIP